MTVRIIENLLSHCKTQAEINDVWLKTERERFRFTVQARAELIKAKKKKEKELKK